MANRVPLPPSSTAASFVPYTLAVMAASSLLFVAVFVVVLLVERPRGDDAAGLVMVAMFLMPGQLVVAGLAAFTHDGWLACRSPRRRAAYFVAVVALAVGVGSGAPLLFLPWF